MGKYVVAVTHTMVHQVTVRAQDEEAAKVRAVEVIMDHSLADDVEIPVEVLDKYETSTDSEVLRRALRERATRESAVGALAHAAGQRRP